MVNLFDNFFANQTPAVNIFGKDPGTLITGFLPNIIVVASVIFFFFIFIAGFPIIAGAGKDSSPQEKAKAKAAITFAVVGFLLIIASFFILQIVQTLLGVNFINPII